MDEELLIDLEAIDADLDLMDDEEQLRLMVDKYVDLQAIRDEIIETGGVSRQMAASLEELSPGIIPEDFPVEGFTKEPGITNLNVATEASDTAVAAAVGVLVGAIAVLLAKVFKWIYDVVTRSRKKAKAGTKAVAKAKTMANASKALRQKMNKEDLGRADARIKEIDEQTNKELLEMHSDLGRDLITKGIGYKTMVRVGKSVDNYIAILFEKLKGYEAVIGRTKANMTDQEGIALIGELTTIATAASISNLGGSDIDAFVGQKTGQTMSGALSALRDKINRMRDEKTTPSFKRSALSESVRSGKIVFDETYLPNAEKTSKNIDKLEAMTARLESTLKSAKAHPQVIEDIRKAGETIKAETRAIQAAVSAINTCIETTNRFAKVSLQSENAVHQVLTSEAGKSSSDIVRDAARASREEVRKED